MSKVEVLASRGELAGWFREAPPTPEVATGSVDGLAIWPVIHWAEGERDRVLSMLSSTISVEAADGALKAAEPALVTGDADLAIQEVLSASSELLVPMWNKYSTEFLDAAHDGDRPMGPADLLHLLAQHEERVVPGLLTAKPRRQPERLGLALLHVEHPDAALLMSALAWSSVDPKPPGVDADFGGASVERTPWWRLGRTWLQRYPHAAASGLLSLAISDEKPTALLARAGLTIVNQTPAGRSAVLTLAARMGSNATAAAKGLIEVPFVPGKTTASARQALPSNWKPGAFPRPVLVASGKALPNDAINALANALTKSSNLVQDPLIGLAQQECTQSSLADFAWAIFEKSIKDGSLAKPTHAWMMSALSWFGDDRCARDLAPLIRDWPRSNLLVRAQRGLEILGDIGTDAALAQLQSLTMRNRYTPTVAAQVLEAVAAERGFSRDQLDDRSVPTLGLDDQGSMRLDVGGPEIVVTIDEAFTPQVHVAGAKPTAKWPKTVQGSDAAKLKAATEEWKDFVADLKVTAGLQAARLERAMVKARAWRVPDFLAYCVAQPLLRAPVSGLVLGTKRYSEEGPVKPFVVTDNGGVFEDVDGNSIELAPDGIVQIMHPIDLGADLSKWLARWKDLGRGQPIAQLSRKLYRAKDDVDGTLFGLRGARIPSGAFRGLLALGWQRDMAGVAGWLEGFRKPTDSGCVWISVDPGIHIDSPGFEETHQTLTIHDFPALSDIEFSEIVREMQTLRQ